MNYLNKVYEALREQAEKHHMVYNYTIPDLWDCIPLEGVTKTKVGDGHIIVNPYHFYQALISTVFLQNQHQTRNFNQPYFTIFPEKLAKKDASGNWIKKSFAYSMMVRTSASFDHDRSGKLDELNMYHLKETGTFVKALALLPLFKMMGIDVLYMLPISKYSRKDKKGESGSPYGVSNFFKIDEGLKEPMTGSDCSVDDEFKAFVEACHYLDIKVIIDIIPRTNSVNSDLIADHPDWFYWIKHADLADYKPPYVPHLQSTLPAKKEYLKTLFQSPEVIQHILKFTPNPAEINPQRWQKLLSIWRNNPNEIEILDLVQQMFGLTVAPAFSDRINDPQPAWSDVTFFRMYLDHPKNSNPYLKKYPKLNPYILYDVAKSSMNPGTIINEELWETLSDIIPYFQTNFGIDGARIDMGHALPEELVFQILTKARDIDPNFCFIAEELDVENAKSSIQKGYNMIIGDGFIRLPRVYEGLFNSFVYGAKNLDSFVFAAGETHDTPRLAARDGGKCLSRLVTCFSLFIPNTVPFLNSGQEVYEKQPMNTGLDCRENEQFVLDQSDPLYGKLALFDRYAFHYLNSDRWDIPLMLKTIMPYRQKYLQAMLDKKSVFPLGFSAPWDLAAGFAFRLKRSMLLVIANTDVFNEKHHYVRLDNLPEDTFDQKRHCYQLYSSEKNDIQQFLINEYRGLNLHFLPGEVKLIEIR